MTDDERVQVIVEDAMQRHSHHSILSAVAEDQATWAIAALEAAGFYVGRLDEVVCGFCLRSGGEVRKFTGEVTP